MADKKADLAGPGIGNYDDLKQELPDDYEPLLSPKERMQEDFLSLPYHQALLNDEIPLSIGGGIGQSRTYMYLLRTAHLGEVSVTVWPKILKDICAQKNIKVLE